MHSQSLLRRLLRVAIRRRPGAPAGPPYRGWRSTLRRTASSLRAARAAGRAFSGCIRASTADRRGIGDALRQGRLAPARRRCPRQRRPFLLLFPPGTAWATVWDARALDVPGRRGTPWRSPLASPGRLLGALPWRPDARHERRVRADDSALPRGTAPQLPAVHRRLAQRRRERYRYHRRVDTAVSASGERLRG